MRALKLIAAALLVGCVGFAGFVLVQVRAFDASVAQDYGVAPVGVSRSSDPAVLARGEHLARSYGGCVSCHGADLGGGEPEEMGPVGTFVGPNLTTGEGGVGSAYDAEAMARAVAHGVGADGRALLFMPSHDFAWWPRDDLEAVASYVLAASPVDRAVASSEVGALGKVLDRFDAVPLVAARRIDHAAPRPETLEATPTAQYGEKLAAVCTGCHGAGLSGGPLPGAPPDLPVPPNLTPHASGLADWSEADFRRLLDEGTKPDGSALDPFMPREPYAAMSEVEKAALWAYLRSLPPTVAGGR